MPAAVIPPADIHGGSASAVVGDMTTGEVFGG
jgi:hypothetical protein